YLTVALPNGQTFNYGTKDSPMQVSGVPFGSILATAEAVEQAWNAYQNANLQNVPAGSGLTVTQGAGGLNLNVNTNPATILPTQTIQFAQGLTVTSPTSQAYIIASAPYLNSTTMSGIKPSQTYTSNGITFMGSQLQSMYGSYEGQVSTALTQQNPYVDVNGTYGYFNSLTPAQQQQYVQQQIDQYTKSLGYNGSGYYNINGKNVYISNPAYYTALLGNGIIGQYEGTTAPQAPVTTSTFSDLPTIMLPPGKTAFSGEIFTLAPVTTPTFTQSQGTATIVLPQGWSVNPTTGDLIIQGNPNNGAPTLQQSEQYANAYAQYLGWYQATKPSTNSAQGQQAFPTTPNWYNQLATNVQGGVYAGNLAALQYAPLAETSSINTQAKALGITPEAYWQSIQAQQQQASQPSLSQQLATIYGSKPSQAAVQGGAGLLFAASPSSAQPISQGNMQSGQATQGMGGLSLSPQYSATAPTSVQALSLSTPQQSGTNTNTGQTSSWTSNPLTNIYEVLAPIPSDVASTLGGIANLLITPPGFTQGGAPLAGGQFPYNYPYNQTYINELHKAETAAVNHTSKYLLQLQMQRAHAGLWAMAGARYEYLSPAFAGPYSVLTDPRISGADAAAVLSCGAGPDKILKGAMRGRNAPARSPILEAARERTTGGTADRKLVLNLLNGGAALLSAMPGYGSSSTAEREGIASTPACSDVSGRSRGRRGAAGLTGGGDAYFRSKALLDADATGLVHGLALNKSAETPSKAKRSGRLRSLAIMAGGAAAGFAAGIALFPAIANALSCL
ncbi:MAG: hypothetical protein M1354_02535, partial [Candidatus Marsarchaeota archaeon]|nr:hypothetical protein [Candidatus Marsarchaeota archaeon]